MIAVNDVMALPGCGHPGDGLGKLYPAGERPSRLVREALSVGTDDLDFNICCNILYSSSVLEMSGSEHIQRWKIEVKTRYLRKRMVHIGQKFLQSSSAEHLRDLPHRYPL